MLSDSSFTSECPKCGKKALIKRQDSLYQCLACNFKKDLEKPEAEPSGIALAFAIALLIILIVTVTHYGITNPCAPNDLQCIERERLNR
ncbi:hypothetical protein H6F67_19325 [Microcoleus sp. FACHB-1515]|uniref:hypothetical protein n=1 Tax=Cyanophyceae TaxID=3028117 RepID=UPI00168861D0|nr:hypothetical protein [Microcoleus sp. FACHB-1515]MBD2092002.1 hypothetical protein [Microcoleus sp. FACHB-1515]